MRTQLVRARLCLLAVVLLYSTLSAAGPAASIQENVDVAISPAENNEDRVKAANDVTEQWNDSVPVLLKEIDGFHQSGAVAPLSKEASGKLLPLTDLLVTIVGTKDGSAQKFREADTGSVVDVLSTAAGGDERALRFNASNILFRVVDDNNLCIVLHRLRDPKLGYSGQINLLQVAIVAANRASRENLVAARETAGRLKQNTDRKTTELATLLEQLSASRLSTAAPLPADSFCTTYDVETGTSAASPGGASAVPPTPAVPPP